MKEFLKTNQTILLALLTLGTCFFIVSIALFKGYDDKNKDVVMFILGFVCSTATGVIQFYFGSSMGSKAKQLTIDKLTEDANDKPTT